MSESHTILSKKAKFSSLKKWVSLNALPGTGINLAPHKPSLGNLDQADSTAAPGHEKRASPEGGGWCRPYPKMGASLSVFLCSDVAVELPFTLMHPKPKEELLHREGEFVRVGLIWAGGRLASSRKDLHEDCCLERPG